ncbi:MAG: FAD-dependent oxidoreductase [Micrococcales bacterium]|nr:FAD-dependent oxidoreductase [Micrococcales bacterium]
MADTETRTRRAAPLEDGIRVDEVVVGAGVVGLVTAVLLAERGRRVAVVDADAIGSGAGGRAGGVASVLQGDRLREVRARNTATVTAAYAQSQLEALEWLRGAVDRLGVPASERYALSFAVGSRGAERLGDELVLARALGIDAEPASDTGLPWRTSAAIRLGGQLLVDAPALLAALAAELQRRGGRIIEHTRVLDVRASSPALVQTDRGVLAAARVVLATGTPILDRGLYFAKLAPRRSYLLESRVPPDAQLPEAMATGVDAALRTIRGADGLLVTGGGAHGTGRAASPAMVAESIAEETARWWPSAEHLGSWSLQGYLSPHRVPFVGWLPRGRGRIFLATGFGDGGLTDAVAVALTLSADLLGGGRPWQTVLHRRPTLPYAMGSQLGEYLAVGEWYLRGWVGALSRRVPGSPAEGSGAVGRVGLRPAAVSTIGGETRALCAVCPHLGAVVSWNDLEHSWDCPAHGSRFAADGAPIEGPARTGLAPLRRTGSDSGT